MLESLITSQTRLKLLLKFFLNSDTTAYLRGLEAEFKESTNAIRVELNRFEGAGLLTSNWEQNKKVYAANKQHPLFSNIHDILLKHVGIDRIIKDVISKLGKVERAWLVGEMAAGKNSKAIEIVIVGNEIDEEYLEKLLKKAEALINRKVLISTFKVEDEDSLLKKANNSLLLWKTN
ncbi:ArsR family transcriptional regulator [Mangrovibacterium lignilyticum]|uniref:ArsR family transcriptional regulator n=1 Tax=Mangrovibacterium lignilyticum TaxID=2668052 RepID=UPI0013D65767|nr:ArsR family transcriptional regulator [Mangrovibacterium lignilyticum]